MKRYLLITMISALLPLGGCSSLHNKSKKDAQQRWTEARLNITYNLAREQLANGDLQKAEQSVATLRQMDDSFLPAYVLAAQVYHEQDRPLKAREQLLSCLNLDPEFAPAHYHLGIIHEHVKDLDSALVSYQAAWENDKQNPYYFLAGVETLIALDRTDEALRAIVQNLSVVEENASIYILAGNIHVQQNQPPEALSMFLKARQVDPVDPLVRESLAFAYHRVGQAEKALDIFNQLQDERRRDEKPQSTAYTLAMGDCYMALGQFHQAKRTYEQVSDDQPLNPLIWTRLAQTSIARGRYPEAQGYADRALTLQPNLLEGLMVKGYVAMHQENYEDAQSWFMRCVNLYPEEVTGYCLLGQAFEKDGQPDKAVTCYRQAQKVSPSD